MGQREVMDILNESNKPLSRTQIAELLEISAVVVSRSLKVLIKFKEVKCIELDRFQTAELLNWGIPWRRTRFYYSSSSKVSSSKFSSGSKDFPSLAKGK